MSVQLKYIQETLAFISKNGYKADYVEFLKSTAVFLAELFDVNCVLIDKFTAKKSTIINSVALYANGSFLPNITYKLVNTPCDNVINKKLCSYPANVSNIFPKDDFLWQNNMESYIGKPLWNSKKEPLGLIALMDTKPKSLSEENDIAIVLDIIGIKIEEVLEKLFFEDQLNLKIGELIIAKEKAEKNEHQLKEAQQMANLGHWEHNIINNKLIWSDEIYRILNLKPQELEAREDLFVKNVHPDDKDKIEEVYLNAFKNKKAYEVEYRLMLPSGEIKYILGKGHKKYDDNGNPIHSFGTVIDITKQKKDEQKLVKFAEEAGKSEDKFRKLSNLIFVGIVITEKDDVALECNKVFLRMFGYSSKEIIGKNLTKLLFPEKYQTLIRSNRNKKQTHPYEIEGIRKDGTVFPIEIEARNIDFGNNTISRLVTFRDLSSSKKAKIENRKLITAIEQSANMVLITDIKGNIEYTNPKFTEITGYTAAEALGKTPSILKSGEQSKEFYANLWQTISQGNIWKGQMKNKTKSGKLYWEQASITPIKDENNNILSYLAIKEDITAKKDADENLLIATEEIAKSEKKFRDLFEKSGDAILIIKNGVFVDCNQTTIDLLGYKDFEAVLNLHPSELSPKFQPDGKDSSEKAEALLKITLEKGTHRFEWWHTKSSGEIFPVEVLLTTIENEPNNELIHCVWRDITHRKKAEIELQKQNEEYEALNEEYLVQNQDLIQLSDELSEKNRLLLQSKDRFINLFEQNPVPLWEQDFSRVIKLLKEKKAETKYLKKYLDENPNFVEKCIKNIKILNANKAALELFGVKNTEELKIHLGKTNSKKALEVLKKELVSIGETKKTFSGETELIGKDGSPILAFIKSVIIDDYGTSIASVIDVTAERNATNELKKAKEIAEKSENSLNEAQKIAQIGSYELDFSTGFWNSSPALNDLFGIDENYNRNIPGWLEIIYPEDLEMMTQYLEKNIIENKEEFSKEYRIIRNADKQIRWVHGLGKLEMDHKGNLKKMIGTIQDISEKRQILQDLIIAKENAEESEKNLKKRAKELLGLFTLHQLTEKNTDSEIIYKTLINDIIPKSMQYSDKVYCKLEINNQIFCNSDNCKICNSKVCKIPEGKKQLSEKIYVNKREIGELIIFYTENLPFIEPYETNLIEAYAQKISVFLDRRDLFEKLIISKEKAEESDRLKTEFIQNMSHEIRTPMNGILGFSELLENPDLSHEKRKKFIEIIRSSTHQLLHIIDDLMEISVLETKQIKAEENPVCLNDLLHELFAVFNLKATNKNISLVLKNGLTNQESTILTDKNKLNKVLSNLLENALKFTNEGFVELGYQLNKDSEPAEMEIYVKDSGIGIKPEKQQLIFDRFSQVERELSKKVGGLGLGLSIAKENVELLGGKISVVSELGKGAAFFVSIPYKPATIAAEISIEKEHTSEKKDKYTILIAEDEDVNFMVLEILLEDKINLPCSIIRAEDGLEAVELCKKNPEIALVLMDIKMPKMDGHEATKRIKEFRPNLPIIAQTAYSTSEEKEKAFLAGCDDFMSKPISKNVLKLMLDKYLLTDKNNRNWLYN